MGALLRRLQRRPAQGRAGADATRDEAHRGAVRDLRASRRRRELGESRTTAASAVSVRRSQDTPETGNWRARRSNSGHLAASPPANERGAAWALAGRVLELRDIHGTRSHYGETFQEEWINISARALRSLSSLEGETGLHSVRRRAWALRDVLRAIHPSERSAACGFCRVGDVGIVERSDGEGGGYTVASVETCNSAATCPVCGLVIKGKRAAEIIRGVEMHRAKFGRRSMVLGTFTIRHREGHPLAFLLDGFQRAWNRFKTRIPTADKQRRKIARRRGLTPPDALLDAFGYLGGVYGLEVTHGVNGWHPHRHEVMCFDRELSDEDRLAFQGRAAAWWSECVAEEMGPDFAPDWHHGFRADRMGRDDESPEDVARYIAKLGLEVADIGAKTAKDGSRNHWAVLLDAARGCSSSLELSAEYARAMKGRKLIQFGESLRNLWKSWGWEAEDEDSADDTRGSKLRLEVPGTAWLAIRASGGLVDALSAPDWPTVEKALRRLAPRQSWRPERGGWGTGATAERECKSPPEPRESREERRMRHRLDRQRWKDEVDGLTLDPCGSSVSSDACAAGDQRSVSSSSSSGKSGTEAERQSSDASQRSDTGSSPPEQKPMRQATLPGLGGRDQ